MRLDRSQSWMTHGQTASGVDARLENRSILEDTHRCADWVEKPVETRENIDLMSLNYCHGYKHALNYEISPVTTICYPVVF